VDLTAVEVVWHRGAHKGEVITWHEPSGGWGGGG
jgi:hypothetical protein